MTERPRSGNEQHQRNTGKRRRATRACIPCRRSKVKCDGKEPCARCKDRDVICMLGVDARSRADKKLGGSNEQNVQQGDRPQNSAQTKDQTNLLNREVHCSITGTDVSASSAMHLHYGPSSSFVFLQQLHRFLLGSREPRQTIINQESGNYTAEAISEFGYTSIFFGREGDVAAEPLSNLGQTNQCHARLGVLKVEQLPFDLAANFLELYLTTIHHIYPFCERATLRNLFHASAESGLHAPYSRDSTLLLAVLALGATVTDDSIWANSLFRQAKASMDSWGDAISLRSVQISALLAEFHQISGRPNSTMLTIGATAQKALAMGLHHETPFNPKTDRTLTEADRIRARERNASFWALYAQDRSLSLFHGRPASINDMDVDISDPVGDCYLSAVVTLSRISNKVYYSVYGRKKGSVAEFCEKVQGLREELSQLYESLVPEHRFPLSQVELRDSSFNITMRQMMLALSSSPTT
jgi:hypothetical protein